MYSRLVSVEQSTYENAKKNLRLSLLLSSSSFSFVIFTDSSFVFMNWHCQKKLFLSTTNSVIIWGDIMYLLPSTFWRIRITCFWSLIHPSTLSFTVLWVDNSERNSRKLSKMCGNLSKITEQITKIIVFLSCQYYYLNVSRKWNTDI